MNDPFSALSNQLAHAVEQAAPAVVQVHAHRRPSAGIVFADDLVLAPARAVDDGRVAVRRADGQTLEGTVIGRGLSAALAVIRVPSLNVTPLVPAPEPRVGHLAIAIGRTWSGGTMATVTSVAVVGGPLRTGRVSRIERVIRIDRSPHGALTGGALVDGQARALGIITGADIRGTTVVIPSDIAWPIAQQIAAHGGTRQGFLGIGSTTVPLPQKQRGESEAEHGLLVTSLVEGGPADTAGVLVGDIVVAFDAAPVSEPEELVNRLRGNRVGQAATLTVVRAGRAQDLAVTVGERRR